MWGAPRGKNHPVPHVPEGRGAENSPLYRRKEIKNYLCPPNETRERCIQRPPKGQILTLIIYHFIIT